MESNSDDDSLIDIDDTSRLNEFDDADKASFFGQCNKVSKVDDEWMNYTRLKNISTNESLYKLGYIFAVWDSDAENHLLMLF